MFILFELYNYSFKVSNPISDSEQSINNTCYSTEGRMVTLTLRSFKSLLFDVYNSYQVCNKNKQLNVSHKMVQNN